MRTARIPLHVTDVDDLIRLGILKKEQRENPEALRNAILRLLRHLLDETRGLPFQDRPTC
jgi:hypothetical protein